MISCGNAIYGIVGYYDSSSSMAWKSRPLAVGIYCFLLGVGLSCFIIPKLMIRSKNSSLKK